MTEIDPRKIPAGKAVRTLGGSVYAVVDGTLRRVDKPRLSKKERRAARERQRAIEAKPVEDIQAAIAAAAAE